MSKLYHSRTDRDKITTMIFSVTRELTFHALTHDQQVALATLFNKLSESPAVDVQCNVSYGHGIVKIEIIAAPEVSFAKTN